ncbi:MAG: LON peptidase substrate-binding domain-containing protein, partial [Muribaculaceae bacterium]|nr:LON peptidase substrate-binding domain-containing protein [Muribaculaceae bacterium]
MDNFNDGGDDMPFGIQKIEIDLSRFTAEPDLDALPVLATRNLVLFPGQHTTMELGRESSAILAKEAVAAPFPVGIVCQLDSAEDHPRITTGLYKY